MEKGLGAEDSNSRGLQKPSRGVRPRPGNAKAPSGQGWGKEPESRLRGPWKQAGGGGWGAKAPVLGVGSREGVERLWDTRLHAETESCVWGV